MGYEDSGFDEILCQYIEVNGIQIPVYNSDLAIALLELTEIQRSILIQNVVLEVTLKQIAYDLKISERMARKHKHNAIESIRRRMNRENENGKK